MRSTALQNIKIARRFIRDNVCRQACDAQCCDEADPAIKNRTPSFGRPTQQSFSANCRRRPEIMPRPCETWLRTLA